MANYCFKFGDSRKGFKSYRGLTSVGAFSPKFSVLPSGETVHQIRTKWCKNVTDLHYHHAYYGVVRTKDFALSPSTLLSGGVSER